MLDYVYTGEPPLGISEIGCAIFRGTTGGPNGQSVIERREIIGQRIDHVAAENSNARILSIACGHLREAQRSTAIRSAERVNDFETATFGN